VKLASLVATRNVLVFSLVAEGATALAVMLAPGLVAALLFGTDVSGAGVAFGRLVGIALLALVIACWPAADAPSGTHAALRAVLVYNLLATVYLAYLGIARPPAGILLWPVVAAHALVALLLSRGMRRD
jgi:hypothetical protein